MLQATCVDLLLKHIFVWKVTLEMHVDIHTCMLRYLYHLLPVFTPREIINFSHGFPISLTMSFIYHSHPENTAVKEIYSKVSTIIMQGMCRVGTAPRGYMEKSHLFLVLSYV